MAQRKSISGEAKAPGRRHREPHLCQTAKVGQPPFARHLKKQAPAKKEANALPGSECNRLISAVIPANPNFRA
jgi:hypothetical protein